MNEPVVSVQFDSFKAMLRLQVSFAELEQSVLRFWNQARHNGLRNTSPDMDASRWTLGPAEDTKNSTEEEEKGDRSYQYCRIGYGGKGTEIVRLVIRGTVVWRPV